MFEWLKKKKEAPKRGNSFEDDDLRTEATQRGIEIKRLNAEMSKLTHQMKVLEKKRELQSLREDVEATRSELYGYNDEEESDDEADPFEDILKNILLSKLTPQTPQQPLTSFATVEESPQSQPVEESSYSDEEILSQLSKIPKKYLKLGKAFDDKTLKSIMKKHVDLNDQTLNRAILLYRNMKI